MSRGQTRQERLMADQLNILSERCHEDACHLGWYDKGKVRSPVESIMLVVTELSEAVEELRKPETKMQNKYYDPSGSNKPEGFGVELADALIRILDLCGYHGINIGDIVNEKLTYNMTRGYRHGNKEY